LDAVSTRPLHYMCLQCGAISDPYPDGSS
jgi:hypothetical protein